MGILSGKDKILFYIDLKRDAAFDEGRAERVLRDHLATIFVQLAVNGFVLMSVEHASDVNPLPSQAENNNIANIRRYADRILRIAIPRFQKM